MKNNIRKNIFNITYDILINKKLSNIVYEEYETNNELDNSLIKKEIFGVLENKILLEYIISKYIKIKISKLNDNAYIVLLLGCYELLFLDKIPSYATINTYVDIIKMTKERRLSSFVNGVLRNIDRNEKLENIYKNNNISDNILYSVPDDLYNIFVKKNININDAFEKNIYLRINSFDILIIEFVLKDFLDKGIEYKKYDSRLDIKYFTVLQVYDIKKILDSDSYKKGLIYFEDVSSIYMIEKIYEFCLKDKKNVVLIDSCSAPGGKITGLYNFIYDNSSMFSFDVSDEKIDLIKENVKRLNINNINIEKKDATNLDNNLVDFADIVILDAPCSGLGVISKKPDIKFNFTIKKMQDLVRIQRKMLSIQKEYIKNGGYLIYSTCTINDDENNRQINEFINKNNNFKLVFEHQILQNNNDKSDGFYFAIMKREL